MGFVKLDFLMTKEPVFQIYLNVLSILEEKVQLNVNMSGKELIIGLIFLGLPRSLYCHHLMEEQLFLMRNI